MVIIQQYYEFVDRPSTEITKTWKVCHIMFYVTASASGFVAYYVFNSLKQQFGDNCVLFPSIKFVPKNVSDPVQNDTRSVIDESKTSWGDSALCDFCQYVPIMSMIIGFVFLTFFVLCPRGGSRLSQSGIKRPWHIVLPSLFLTGIFTVIIFTSSIITKNGVYAFCAEFAKELNVTECTPEIERYALKVPTFDANTVVYIDSLNALLFICVFAWFVSFLILLCRCCCVADFKLIEVTISTIDGLNTEDSEVLLKRNPTSSPVSHV